MRKSYTPSFINQQRALEWAMKGTYENTWLLWIYHFYDVPNVHFHEGRLDCPKKRREKG